MAKRPASSRRRRQHLNPIDFGRAVPSRLAAHALVHGLIRQGLTAKAAKEVRTLMEDGMKIRTKTLEACLLSLNPSNPPMQTHTQLPLILKKKPVLPLPKRVSQDQAVGPEVLHLRGSLVTDPYTRFAVRLVLEARRQGYKRTKRSYNIAALLALVQGELLVASLIYATSVKDHNANDTPAATESEAVSAPHVTHTLRWRKERERLASRPVMQALTSTILSTLTQPRTPEGDNYPSYDAAFQALANLASLMDDHLVPSQDLATLISALSSAPYDKSAKVWIRKRNGPDCQVYAGRYFERVLDRFMESLLAGGVRPIGPISLRAYNALIHFALRQRFSPYLASALLEHMSACRSPPIEPDITTFNTIIRASTLARKTDTADSVLRLLVQARNGGVLQRLPEQTEPKSAPPVGADTSVFSQAVRRYHNDDMDISRLATFSQSPAAEKNLHVDAYTLSIYISHLVATGRAEVIGDVLFEILPEISLVNHPAWGKATTYEERRHLRRLNRRDAIRRAAQLGPWFFTAVLNALRKAGRVGLTERVWRLAKDAERFSWVEGTRTQRGEGGSEGQIKPWCLPVHAYTVMMQSYVDAA
ncbi:hypothetical protein PUNSTDRAFT_64605, partial [Punctularia strigosozonata HHB-11173 SS5]|uniref:uncharacterized protein n=1 Tax=Punctularia strigosozonata (strain HHB-11173) TaxID=741275 RepID=UPI0004416720